MKRSIIFGIVAMAALALPFGLSAQEHKRVEVTTTYNPEVAPAKKLTAPTTISDVPGIEPEIRYNIKPESWQIELDDHQINPTKSNFWDFGRAKRFYTQLASGYPLMSKAKFHYATNNVRLGYFGVGIDHDGNFARKRSFDGMLRSMSDSYDMQNRLYVGGGVFAGCRMFEVGLEYNCDLYNNYATVAYVPNVDSAVLEPSDDMAFSKSDLLTFHDAGLILRFGDDFVNLSRLNFAVEAHGGIWAHNLPASGCTIFCEGEFRAGASALFARKFGLNTIDLKAEFDMWMQPDDLYQDMRFGLTAGYARTFGFIDLKAGIGYMYDKVRDREKPSHFVKPQLKLLFDTGTTAITPYVEFNTSVSQNGISNLYKENPYIYYRYYIDENRCEDKVNMYSTMPNTRSYNLALGFSGSAISSRLEYRLYFGANFMRDQLIWTVATPGTFSVAADNNNRIFFGAELGCRPIGGLHISGSIYAHADNTDSMYVVDDARFKANLKAEYKIKRWKMYVSSDFMGKRRWSQAQTVSVEGKAPVAFEAPSSIDLRVGLSFKASKRVEIYADGYNLLNDDIFDYAYYYRNGTGFMAGVKIDF